LSKYASIDDNYDINALFIIYGGLVVICSRVRKVDMTSVHDPVYIYTCCLIGQFLQTFS